MINLNFNTVNRKLMIDLFGPRHVSTADDKLINDDKVNKSGKCHNLGPGRVPWRNVSEPLMVGLDFHVISIFFLHRTLYKIHMWKLFVYEKIFGHGKIKSGRKSSVKKKGKKIGAKKKERVPFCQEKRIPL